MRTAPAARATCPAASVAASQSLARGPASWTTPAGTVATSKHNSHSSLRSQWVATAVAPHLRGRRATAWLGVWDSASAGRRVSMLEALKTLHSASNSNALEEDLGDAAPLLLTRVTSWWKLRYKTLVTGAAAAVTTDESAKSGPPINSPASRTPALNDAREPPPTALVSSSSSQRSTSELLAQLEAITLFVRGSRYLLQFVESGGVATLTDNLEVVARSSTPEAVVQERRAITLLLLQVANAGRVYREMVGDTEGLVHILRSLLLETDDAVAAPLTELLAVLGQGHPRLASSVQTGLLRLLATAVHNAGRPSASREGAGGSEVVVLHTARAIRALQLQKEQQHYSKFAVHDGHSGSGAVLDAGMDYVPIVGMDNAVNACSFTGSSSGISTAPSHVAASNFAGAASVDAAADVLLCPLSRTEYLDTLFQLALDDAHLSFRVEGSELLSLAAKNLYLTQDILMRCLDTVDDDEYVVRTNAEEDVAAQQVRLRRQRRQLSCGRTAVLLLISRPMTSQRRQLLLRLMSQRSAHLTILKHLRLATHGDAAAVVDCCHALQFIVRAATEMQRQQMDHTRASVTKMSSRASTTGNCATPQAVWLRVTQGVQAALGDSVFQLLLFQDLSEADCMVILRAARAAVVPLGEEVDI